MRNIDKRHTRIVITKKGVKDITFDGHEIILMSNPSEYAIRMLSIP
ncbi:MAG TPA: hypothetical protein VH500_15290 [Nitrososphaeraceae archaeon]|jgi:hypothetical protein